VLGNYILGDTRPAVLIGIKNSIMK